MEFPWGNELFMGEFQMINVNPWSIPGGTKISKFSNQFLRIFYMGKYEGKYTFDWEFPNDMCQSMGTFHWENKILGVLGEVTPLTGDKKPEMAYLRILPCRWDVFCLQGKRHR